MQVIKIYKFLANSIVFSASLARAAQPFSEPLSLQALEEFAKRNKITSIDQIIPLLPEDMRSNFTLVYGSRSPEAVSISPAYPRVILFSKDGRSLLAFTTDPSKPFYNSLQMIEFDERASQFKFGELSFNQDKEKGNTHIRANAKPTSCASCHGAGANAHPIWDSYALWPGVYGSFDDRMDHSDLNGNSLDESGKS